MEFVGLVNHQEVQEKEEDAHREKGDDLEDDQEPESAVPHLEPDVFVI